MYKRVFVGSSIVLSVVCLLCFCVYSQFGIAYRGMDYIGRYRNLLPSQYSSFNPNGTSNPEYVLPEQYPFYGRLKLDSNEEFLHVIVNDRMVSRCNFEYSGQLYYYYFSKDHVFTKGKESSGPFEFTYPDIYDTTSDTIIFTLWKNPGGCFIQDNYLYYVYGENYYLANQFGLDGGFTKRSVKDHCFARLDLDTGENVDISKGHYEAMRKSVELATWPFLIPE